MVEPNESNREPEEAAGGEPPPLPDPTLQTHIFHLASQVSMALGDVENPITNKREVDLRSARFLIDTISMLEEKTRDHRTPEEDTYITGVLTNLRMSFVNKTP